MIGSETSDLVVAMPHETPEASSLFEETTCTKLVVNITAAFCLPHSRRGHWGHDSESVADLAAIRMEAHHVSRAYGTL